MSEDELTSLIAKAREKFIDLGQEPLDGCSMERFIARELLKDNFFQQIACGTK